MIRYLLESFCNIDNYMDTRDMENTSAIVHIGEVGGTIYRPNGMIKDFLSIGSVGK